MSQTATLRRQLHVAAAYGVTSALIWSNLNYSCKSCSSLSGLAALRLYSIEDHDKTTSVTSRRN